MYWFSPDQASTLRPGFDICCARLHVLGFDVYSYQERNFDSDFPELLMKPLKLAMGNELLDKEFGNILHALQVFYQCSSKVCISIDGMGMRNR